MLAGSKNRDSYRLWSLWDILILDAQKFIVLLHTLFNTELMTRGVKGSAPPKMVESGNAACASMVAIMRELGLSHSIKVAESLLIGADTAPKINRAFDQLANSVMLELQDRKFFGPLQRYEQYFEQPKLFGDEVFARFPSANNDIFEAGTCLALERGTACVMHLMRVVEAGLKALATALDVGVQANWGSYLREIDKALEARLKAAGKRTADEQFYAEVRVTLDGVRMAWRNPTMHIESSYSPERAEQILVAVRGLMQHLATKLREPIHHVMNAETGSYSVDG